MPIASGRPLRVFVSSRMEELAVERAAVKRALEDLLVVGWVFEQDAGARPRSIQNTYLEEVAAADLFVGLFWEGYGPYTVEEYREAQRLGKDCLVYEKRTELERRDPRLAEFLDELGSVESGVTVRRFTTPEALGAAVKDDVAAWQAESVRGTRAPPFEAPTPRSGYVPRPALLAAIVDRLSAASGGALRVVAAQGMGGSGKSVMAMAAAGDARVRHRFRDGVLWTTLGTTPNLAAVRADWARALGVERATVSVGDLNALLRDKAVLIVLDDAWDAGDVIAGGPDCAVLLTTREVGIARAAGSGPQDIIEVGPMRPNEAEVLLAGGAGRTLPADDRPEALAVAKAVGYLPLALRLAAAQSADGVGWDELRADLSAEIARLESLDDASVADVGAAMATKELSLIASLNLSVARLSDQRREQFARLGVFGDDMPFTAAACARLWEIDERSASVALRHLRAHGLLLAPAFTMAGVQAYTVHDTVLALARRLLVAEQPLVDARRTLVEAYRRQLGGNAWPALRDDGFILDNLVWLLEHAGLHDEIHALLGATATDGTNAWFAVRDAHARFAGYASDVQAALRLARTEGSQALELRCALLLASVNSLAHGYPPALIGRAVEVGVFSLEHARSYVDQTSDPLRAARGLAHVAAHAPDDARRAMLLEAVATIAGCEDQGGLFGWLAERLDEARLRDDALALVRRAKAGADRTRALAALAERRDGPERAQLVGEALTCAAATDELYRYEALVPLLPFLDVEQVEFWLQTRHRMNNRLLSEYLVPFLAGRLAQLGRPADALRVVRELDHEPTRADGLAQVAHWLDQPERDEALLSALATMRRFDDAAYGEAQKPALAELGQTSRMLMELMLFQTHWREQLLGDFPDALSEPVRIELLALLDDGDDAFRVRATAAAAHCLPEHVRSGRVASARAMARAIESPDERLWALAELFERVDGPIRESTRGDLQSALINGGSSSGRATAIVRLAGEADPAMLLDVIADLEPAGRDEALEALAPRLSPGLVQRALTALRMIHDADERLLARCALAPALSRQARTRALEAVANHPGERKRAQALARLVPCLDDVGLERALDVYGSMDDGVAISVAAAALAARVDEPRRGAVLRRAIAQVALLTDFLRASEAVKQLRGALSPSQAVEALDALRIVGVDSDPQDRAVVLSRMLAAVLPALGAPERSAVGGEALDFAAQLRGWEQQTLLAEIGPELDEPTWERAVALVADQDDWDQRLRGYVALLSTARGSRRRELSARVLSELRATVHAGLELDSEGMQAACAEVILHWPDPAQRLTVVENLASRFRGQAFKALATGAPELHEQLEALARGFDAGADRGSALLALGNVDEALKELLAGGGIEDVDVAARAVAALGPDRAAAGRRVLLTALPALGRPGALQTLTAGAPLFDAAMAHEAIAAIADAGRWWP